MLPFSLFGTDIMQTMEKLAVFTYAAVIQP
jgi:hypothetical protein